MCINFLSSACTARGFLPRASFTPRSAPASSKLQKKKIAAFKDTKRRLLPLFFFWSHLREKKARLTWPDAPGSPCSGRAGCRTARGSPLTSSWRPSPPCSPPACWRSRPGQSRSPCGSSCGTEGEGDAEDVSHWKRKGGRQMAGSPFFLVCCLFWLGNTFSPIRWKKTGSRI